jgi:hypothetical protein
MDMVAVARQPRLALDSLHTPSAAVSLSSALPTTTTTALPTTTGLADNKAINGKERLAHYRNASVPP